MIDFKELIDCIRKEEVTLFIGSGFSLKAGAPSVPFLSKAIIDAMNPDDQGCMSGNQLGYVANEYEQMYGRNKLLSLLESIMTFTPGDTSDQHNLTKIPHFHTIITTNYDTLLEDAYGEDKCYVVRNAKDCIALPNDKTVIYKIHGDFKAKENIVVTNQDYTDFFVKKKDSVFWNHIVSQILTKDILFIGYSLEDSNIFEIMKAVKTAVGGETRHFFLIAPNLRDYKINRLAETNVKYYDCKAEDLFPQLFQTLDKKIEKDYRNKKISLTTLTKYSEQHKLTPVASEKKDKNIVHFNPNGRCDYKINFTIADKNVGNKFLAHDTSLFTSFLPNNSNVPSFKMDKGILKSIEIQMNDMTVSTEDEISCLYVAPAFAEDTITIRVPEAHISEKIKMTRYTLNHTLTLKAQLEGYVLSFYIKMKESNLITCTCNITLTDTYSNNSDALKWIELPLAMWSGKKFTLSILPNIPMQFTESNNPDFNVIKQYYKNIQDIELLYNVDFATYNCYSPEVFETSKILINSHNEATIPIRLNDNICTTDIDGTIESVTSKLPLNQRGFSLAMTQVVSNKVTFNGLEFELKQRHTIIEDCTLLDVTTIDDKQVRLKIKINSNTIFQKYSDKDLSEIETFNHFKRL